MSIPQIQSNQLESCFAELERLQFGRPPNVLLSEYLAALVAERILDSPTAERTIGVYHWARFAGADLDDPHYQSACSALQETIASIEALPEHERLTLASKVQGRLKGPLDDWGSGSLNRRASAKVAESEAWHNVMRLADAPALSGPIESPRPADERTVLADRPKRFRFRLLQFPRIPFELAFVGGIVVFVAGYLTHYMLENRRSRPDWSMAGAKMTSVLSDHMWENDETWNRNAMQRAQFEHNRGNANGARHLYELMLSYKQDPELLNNLAWLYLTSRSVHDPKRGLDLALKSLAINRLPHIIDTTAEGYYQAGNVSEAIKLEKEALLAAKSAANDQQYVDYEKQLASFQAESYFQAGKVAEAIQLEQQAIAPTPSGRRGVRYREYLRKLAKFQAAQKEKEPPHAANPAKAG